MSSFLPKAIEAQGCGEGQMQPQGTMPCDHTPDSSGYPTERLLEIILQKVTPFFFSMMCLDFGTVFFCSANFTFDNGVTINI